MVRDKSPAQPYPAKGQVAVIRPYVKKIMFKREQRISFNVFDEAESSYNGGRVASPLFVGGASFPRGERVRQLISRI